MSEPVTAAKTSESRVGIPKKIRFEVLKRDSFKCQYCGHWAPDVLLEIDHITPVARGGVDEIWNLVTSCQPCNSGKSDRPLSDQSVVLKAKRQLDELQARREQIEMLMEWHRGLSGLDQKLLDEISGLVGTLTAHQFSVNAHGRETIGKLAAKYGYEEEQEDTCR